MEAAALIMWDDNRINKKTNISVNNPLFLTDSFQTLKEIAVIFEKLFFMI